MAPPSAPAVGQVWTVVAPPCRCVGGSGHVIPGHVPLCVLNEAGAMGTRGREGKREGGMRNAQEGLYDDQYELVVVRQIVRTGRIRGGGEMREGGR